MEIWKKIKEYEGIYEVSNKGRIKNTEKILKPSTATTGYKKIELSRNGKRKSYKVHRLVALMFLGENPSGKTIINHKDGNPINNHVENLEWCNQSYNMQHAYDTGLKKSFKMDKELLIKESVENNMSAREIATKYGTTGAIIHKLLKEKYNIDSKVGVKNKFNLTVELLKEQLKNKKQYVLADELGCTQSLISLTLKKYKRMGLI